MPFREKFTWVSLVASAIVASVYVILVLSQAGARPVTAIAYQIPLIAAVAVTIVLTIVGTIVFEIRGRVAGIIAGDRGLGDLGRVDDRDREIALEGQAVGANALAVGALVALMLAMTETDQFWVANALYASFLASSIVAALVRLAAYRRSV